jgi:Recombination directionality factor-like
LRAIRKKEKTMASILGENSKRNAAQSRLPVSGKIRPGSKAISKTAAQNPKAALLFEQAKLGLMSFKDAEKEIADKCNIKFPFYPTNTQHFNLYAHDIEGGQSSVDRILGLYGEMRDGDNATKLYSFPVVFPDMPNGIEGVFPSEYRVDAGAVKYHSAYGDDGIRRCMYLKEIDRAQQTARKKWLRRSESVRGECNPSVCAEFAKGQCRFNGTLQFYIPGAMGSGAFSMRTGSAYAAEDIFFRLEEMYKVCGGVLPRFDSQGNPVFSITKAKKSRTYFDEAGEKKTSDQWVLVIETSVEMSKVLLLEERKRLSYAAPAPVPPSSAVPSAWLAEVSRHGSGPDFDEPVQQGVAKRAEAKADPLVVDLNATSRNAVVPVTKLTPTSTTGPMGAKLPMKLPKSVLSAEDAVEKLIALSDSLQLNVWDWAEAKFGSDWEADKAVTAHEELLALIDAVGENLGAYLELMTLLHANKIPVKELAFPYLKQTLNGSFKQLKFLRDAFAHLEDLLESGSESAMAHMTLKLRKLAKAA